MKRLIAILSVMALAAGMCVSPVFAQPEQENQGHYYNIALGNQSVDAAIFDGDETTGWTFEYDTMTIDLGEVYQVNRIEIVSSNATVSVNGWGETGRDQYGPIEGNLARVICLTDYTFVSTEGVSASTLYEVRVYGARQNIALGNQSVDAAIFDGDVTTGWTFEYDTMTIDLGAVYEVKSIEIVSSTNTVVINGWGETGRDQYDSIEGKLARIICLTDWTYYNTQGASASTLYEVRVYGKWKSGLKNIALGNTSADGTAAMFDGDKGTSAVCPAADFVVDLGAVYPISSINIDIAETTNSVIVSRYSTDISSGENWIYDTPKEGAQARYLVVSDFGYYYGGNVYSTVNEIEVFIEDKGGEAAHHIVYDANGGTGAPADGFSYESRACVEALGAGSMTRDGYTFRGWSLAAADGNVAYRAGSCVVLTNVVTTLYAVWEPVSPLYVSAIDYTKNDTAVVLNSVSVRKQSALADPDSVMVYVGVFNSDDMLMGIASVSASALETAEAGAIVSIPIETEVALEAGRPYQIRAFLWNPALVPYAAPRLFDLT